MIAVGKEHWSAGYDGRNLPIRTVRDSLSILKVSNPASNCSARVSTLSTVDSVDTI